MIDNERESGHARQVREMFAGIAGRYDLLNHLLSGNVDKRWRKLVARKLQPLLNSPDRSVLDVACGTGDLSLVLSLMTNAKVVASDFCRPMLEVGVKKVADADRKIPFVEADALKLPFKDGQFDAVTIAFGLRNLSNVENGLSELCRVLKPNGQLAVLEFSTPVIPGFRWLFRLYFSRVLPIVGGWISGCRGAYRYLPDSVVRFPGQKQLSELMVAAGFRDVEYTNLTGGIAALHLGTRDN